MKYIATRDLIEGQVYQTKSAGGTDGAYIFKCGKSGTNKYSHRIITDCKFKHNYFQNDSFGSPGNISGHITFASDENRKHLEDCIKAGEYIDKIKEIIYEIY